MYIYIYTCTHVYVYIYIMILVPLAGHASQNLPTPLPPRHRRKRRARGAPTGRRNLELPLFQTLQAQVPKQALVLRSCTEPHLSATRRSRVYEASNCKASEFEEPTLLHSWNRSLWASELEKHVLLGVGRAPRMW